MNQTEGMSEHIKVSLFIKSLSIDIAQAVSFRKPNTIHEAVQVARDYEYS
jgi:hypothetical protein